MALYRRKPYSPFYVPKPRFIPTKLPLDIGESGTNPHITAQLDTSNVSSYVFSTLFSWQADSPLILSIFNCDADAAELPNTPTTPGLTWVQFATVTWDGSLTKRITCYYANPSAIGTNQALTITFSEAQTCCSYSVEQYIGGVNTSSCIAQYKTGFSTTTSDGPWGVGFDYAIGTGNELQFSCAADANVALTPKTGWTSIASLGDGAPAHKWMVAWRTTKDLTPNFDAATNRSYGIIAFEVRMATAGGPFPFYIHSANELSGGFGSLGL